MIGPQALAVFALLQRLAENCNLGAERMRQLDAHVSETAETDNRHLFSGDCAPVLERRIESDPGAEQGSGRIERQIIGDAKNVVFVDDDPLGIAAISWRAVVFASVVGPHRMHVTILLEALLTGGTGPA